MKRTTSNSIQRKALVVAVQAALLALIAAPVAWAEDAPAGTVDPAVAELLQPDYSVDVGVVDTSRKSYKFGEYNGLDKKGPSANVNFLVGSKRDENSAMRWMAEGTNLGLDTRRLEAEGGKQGTYNLRFVYDELPHRYSDTFRTIYNGTGSTALTLPAGYPAAASRVSSTSSDANTLANWNNIQAPNAVSGIAGGGPGYLIPSLMHNVDIGTKRKKIEGGASYIFLPGWDVRVAVREDSKNGTKLTGYAFNSASTAAMMVEPINFKTTNLDLGLGYTGEKGNASLAYTVSSFKNDVKSWTAQSPFAGATGTTGVYNNLGLFSSAPENKMQLMKLSGGYRVDQKTRVSFEANSTKMTQDSTFNCQVDNAGSGCVNGVNGWIIPVASPNAKVVTKSMLLKLTSRPVSNVTVNASYKYDNRDNQTPINTFRVNFADAMGTAATSITNDPINVKKQLFSLDGEYAFASAQAVKAAYQRENISRTTDGNGYAPSRIQTTANSNDFSLPVHKTKEDTMGLEYRNSSVEDLNGRLSYARSKRSAQDYASPTFAATTNTATLLTNAYYLNFRDFFVADRTRDKVRGALDYQAGKAWALGFSVDHNRDTYTDAALKEVTSTIYNLDATYAPDEKLSLTPYFTYEDRKSSLKGVYIVSSAVAGTTLNSVALINANGGACSVTNLPCIVANGNWGLDQADKVNTLGLAGKYKGLMDGKLDLNGDVLYIYTKTPISASGSGQAISNANGGTTVTTPNYVSVPALSYQDITSKTMQLRLTGNYKLDKQQSVRISYQFQRMLSSDWQYDAYTNPVAMQAFIGTGMTSPNFTVHVVGVSYVLKFQ